MALRYHICWLTIFLAVMSIGVCYGQRSPLEIYDASQRAIDILKQYEKYPRVKSLSKERYKAVHNLELRTNGVIGSQGLRAMKLLFPEQESKRFYLLLEPSVFRGSEMMWRFMCFDITNTKLRLAWSIKLDNYNNGDYLEHPSVSLLEYLRTRGCRPGKNIKKNIGAELAEKRNYTVYNFDTIMEIFYCHTSNWYNQTKIRKDIWSAFDVYFDPVTGEKLVTYDPKTHEEIGRDKFFVKYGYPPSKEEVAAIVKESKSKHNLKFGK